MVLRFLATFEIAHPMLDSTGIQVSPRVGRPALVTVGDAQEPGRLVGWGEIERVDSGTSHAARFATTGLLVGAVAGATLVGIYGQDIAESGDHAIVLGGAVLAVTGFVAGALVGLAIPSWKRVYP